MYSLLQLENGQKLQDAKRPQFFEDLNLDQILELATKDWGESVLQQFYAFPKDFAEEAYRREIYGDVKTEEVFSALLRFQSSMRAFREFGERRDRAQVEAQKQAWHLREAFAYVTAIEDLKADLEKAAPKSKGMQGLLQYLSECVAKKEYADFCAEVKALWAELSGFRVLLTYEKERFTIAEGKGEGAYEKFLTECFPEHEHRFRSPFLGSEECSDLEEEILKLFRKKHKEFFGRLEAFFKKQFTYVQEGIMDLLTEMGYYLSFAQFQRKMEARGYAFCTPSVKDEKDKKISAKALYDLALAILCSENDKEIVSNEAYLAPDERFFVLTGPNQGGKTTYARSLGQLIYFAKMGLDVPAQFAEVPYYRNLWTHFSVEESAETGRGKLMDELVRLKPMMEKGQTDCFVVINELFTTAANYDANVMGKRVLEYFIGERCEGIYVTHLGELSKACEGVVSLRACVDERQVQTYVIKRSEALETAFANLQARKYGLTYQQLKERFS